MKRMKFIGIVLILIVININCFLDCFEASTKESNHLTTLEEMKQINTEDQPSPTTLNNLDIIRKRIQNEIKKRKKIQLNQDNELKDV
ncbi:CLUMA_CG003983, isoform A [Clunio marinus]|uniref:CLUMA_CG003983, isoform A n=1 Tax=Clunio marinus TaxID=568069 RepID=A0A1J1HQD3_9DIPT|nr:CLUMA_CG003983, isoform A [Clunio marinus]